MAEFDDEFSNFCDDLEITLSNLNQETPLCSIVLGDFNARNKKWLVTDNNNGPGVELDKLFSLTGFTQLIKDPTNLEPNKQQTCIDLIFTNQTNLITNSGVHPSLFETCHHQILFVKIDLKFYLPPPYEREVWSYNLAQVEQINRAVSLFDWHGALSSLDVNEQVDLFNETLLNIFRNFIPNKTIKHNSKDPPWVSQEIKTSLRKKARLYKKFRRDGSKTDDLNNFKKSF